MTGQVDQAQSVEQTLPPALVGEIKLLNRAVGSVSRLIKDYEMYLIEIQQESGKLSKMQSDGKDVYDVNKQKEILRETELMVPQVQKSLEQSTGKLLEQMEMSSDDIKETEDFKKAQNILQKAEETLEKLN